MQSRGHEFRAQFMTVTSLSVLGGGRLPASGGLGFQKSDL